MRNHEIKDLLNTVKDVDVKTRRVKVAVSEVESKDLDNDVIAKDAYTKTVAERGPNGTKLIWHLTDHNASLKSAVGKPSVIAMEGNYLTFTTEIPDTNWGNDVMKMYDSGLINQHSIGFRTSRDEMMNVGKSDEYRLIKEVMLYEGSAVLFGANPNTPTLTVGKSLTKKECIDEYAKTIDELNKLSKMFKQAYLTDETYGLIELKISQLSDKLQLLFDKATHAADEAPAPVKDNNNERIDKALNQFVTLLKK